MATLQVFMLLLLHASLAYVEARVLLKCPWDDKPGRYSDSEVELKAHRSRQGLVAPGSLLECKALCEEKYECVAVHYNQQGCFWYQSPVPERELKSSDDGQVTFSSKDNGCSKAPNPNLVCTWAADLEDTTSYWSSIKRSGSLQTFTADDRNGVYSNPSSWEECKKLCDAKDWCMAIEFDINFNECYWFKEVASVEVLKYDMYTSYSYKSCKDPVVESYAVFEGRKLYVPKGDGAAPGVYKIDTANGETVEECKQACDAKPACKMFNHYKDENTCRMKSVTKDDVNTRLWKKDSKVDAYEKLTTSD